METSIILVILFLVLVLIVLPVWMIVKTLSLGSQNETNADRLHALESDFRALQETLNRLARQPAADATPPTTPPASRAVASETEMAPASVPVIPLAAAPEPTQSAPILPPAPVAAPESTLLPPPPEPPAVEASAPAPEPVPPAPLPPSVEPQPEPPPLPPLPTFFSDAPAPAPVTPANLHREFQLPPEPPAESFASRFNWEQFMGAKLFAWLGGFAALLGIAFFVKYSFEHNLIPPEVRAAIGFLVAVGLVIGGLKLDRVRYAITAHTLIATGIVSLYTVTFACRSLYKFPFFDTLPTFLVMVLITAAAFLLAVRLSAQAVAILGILGGFLTPLLVHSGQDNPLGLFGYVALLDVGLIAVALHRRWLYLVPLGTAGTIGMQIGWAANFFAADPGAQASVAIVVCVAFAILFLAATIFARRRGASSHQLTWSAVVIAAVCYGFGIYFLGFPRLGVRVGLLFSFVLLANLCLLTLAWFEGLAALVGLAAAGTVLLLANWAAIVLSPALAPTAMGVCVGFSAFFLATYFAARRFGRATREVTWSAIALPLVAFAFALVFLKYPEIGHRVGLLYSFVLAASLCLFVLAWFERMPALVAAAAIGVGLVLVAWLGMTVSTALAPLAMLVCLGFCVLFLLVYLVARRWHRGAREITWSAIALPLIAFGFAFFFLGNAPVSARPGLLFTFVLLADICLLLLAWCDEEYPQLPLVAGLLVFLLLAAWTGGRLTAPLLPWALAFYLLHAVLHTAFPLLLARQRPATVPSWWSQLFPPMALLLMLLPLFKLDALSVVFWPCMLLVDLLAIALAAVTASLAAVGAVLVLTLVATGVWVFHVPATIAAAPSLLFVIGGFSFVFFGAGIFLARRLGERLGGAATSASAVFGDVRAQLPAMSALLPFLLLIMMTQRLALANPSAVFGLALVLALLVLGLAAVMEIEWLPACALAGVAGLEYSWRSQHPSVELPGVTLAWYLGFYALFVVYPFVFRRRFAAVTGPWVVAAIGGAAQFPLVYRLVIAAWPNHVPGVLPALFAVAPLLSLVAILRCPPAASEPAGDPARLNQLAIHGAVALLFITLVFPIQFERQWLTLGWALEGAALLWLFHRVPHAGLRVVGAALLVTAFVRLALNPAVFEYHARSSAAVWNWYFYSYGLVTACLFAGAHLTAPPRERVLGVNTPPLLNTLGTILAFCLVNIEIADFFSVPGQRVLTFQFSGNFARDMSYTIAWALFALGLLLVSIWQKTRAGRYAALALLSVALLKLFFHDLARLDALYRIGALFAVAIIAIVASFAYQRFLPANEKPPPPS